MALFAQLLLRVLLEMKREWPLKVMLRGVAKSNNSLCLSLSVGSI